MRRTVTTVLLAWAATLAGVAPPAAAGGYRVVACSPSTSTGAWAPVNTFPASFTVANLCGGPELGPPDASNQGAFYAEDVLGSAAHIPNGSIAGWTFSAPPGTTITAIEYSRTLAAYNDQDIASGLYLANGQALEECRIPWPFVDGSSIVCSKDNSQGPIAFTGLNTTSLFVGISCRIVRPVLACGAGGTIHAARAAVYSAQVTLADDTLPTLSAPTGPLWAGGVIGGQASVSWSASDDSGIKEIAVRVGSATIASAAQACDYTRPRPCPQQAGGVLNVDTRQVPDGAYTFTLVVTDTAGNTRTAASPTITVRNRAVSPPPPPPPPGAGPADSLSAVIHGRRLRVRATLMSTSGRVRVSWRARRRGRTVARGSRLVTARDHRVRLTFVLPRRARAASTAVAIRSRGRVIVSTRARRRSS